MYARTVLQITTWHDDLEFVIREHKAKGKFGYWISRGPGGHMGLLSTTNADYPVTEAHAFEEISKLLEKALEVAALFDEGGGLMTRATVDRILSDLRIGRVASTYKYKQPAMT